MNLRSFIKYALFRDTTQHGEFRAMQRLAGPDCPRIIVDVGANDGFYASNSFPFVMRGWRALLIEPHPGAFARLRQRHAGRANVTALNLACADAPGELPLHLGADEGGTLASLCPDDHWHNPASAGNQSVLVRVERLDGLLAQQQVSRDFGILSIDAEGMDYEVLLGLDLKVWKPRIIVTEDFDAKVAQKSELLQRHGYVRREQCGVNSLWTRSGT